VKADWYFDFVSPFAYLQSQRLGRLQDAGLEIHCRPVLFAAILDHWGQLGPAEIGPKRELTYRAALWRSAHDGIELRLPAAHPFNPLPLLRLCIAAGNTIHAVREIFAYVWREGRLPEEPGGLEELGVRLGLDDWADRIAEPGVKAALRDSTRRAIEAGVFGVPTVVVNRQIFWGDDMTAMLLDYCRDPTLFDRPPYHRISGLPVAARRQRTSGSG